MSRVITRFLLLSIVTISFHSSYSQKKELTNEQLLKNKLPAIVSPLPTIVSWETDERLILSRRPHPDSAAKTFLFDPKTVKEMMIKEDSAGRSRRGGFRGGASNERGEVNRTYSPDSNYVAYTKKNNLYYYDVKAKKKRR